MREGEVRHVQDGNCPRRPIRLHYRHSQQSRTRQDPLPGYLMGDEARLPETFVSEAGDGTLTLQFVSREGYDEAGWVAEVDEIPSSNSLALIAATARMQGAEAKAKVPISLRILNRWGNDAKGVTVRITDVNGRFITELIN